LTQPRQRHTGSNESAIPSRNINAEMSLQRRNRTGQPEEAQKLEDKIHEEMPRICRYVGFSNQQTPQ
jgi:hypothetical protein